MKEQRVSLRHPDTVEVRIDVNPEGSKSFTTENLSIGGFHILMDKPFMMGEVLKTHIYLPGFENKIKAKCEVVWREAGSGCGLKFLYIPKSHLSLIESFLNQSK